MISFKIASSCNNTPLPMFLGIFAVVLESTFWNAAELFCHGHLNVSTAMAFQCLFQSWEKEKNCKVTNLENMAHAASQCFDVLTKIL
jgi:hypothetical protein